MIVEIVKARINIQAQNSEINKKLSGIMEIKYPAPNNPTKAKKDDVNREKTNREFAEKTELLTRKGEQIRKEAGAVPFASEKKDNL